METAAVVTIVIIAVALLGILVLPMRKRWNDDGAADAARRQTVARDLEHALDPQREGASRLERPADRPADGPIDRPVDPPRDDATRAGMEPGGADEEP